MPLFFTKYLSLAVSFSGEIILMGIAGVFPVVISIPRFSNYFSDNKLISAGCIIYALAIILLINGNTVFYYISGVLLGAGWGMIYTLGPIMISRLSDNDNRANNFSYISAFNMLGAGISPVVVNYLIYHNISMLMIYYIAFLLASGAAFTFLFCGAGGKEESREQNQLSTLSLQTVISTRSVMPMIMVLLAACIFSSMMNFQTLIADARKLNFSYFYIAYTASVIISRLTLTRYVNSFRKEIMMILLLILMTLSILLMTFVTNNVFYIFPSALLGLSYGLVYPLIQSIAVNFTTSENERKNNLTVFSLCYFIGVYAFPYLFSLIISHKNYGYALNILILISVIEVFFSVFLLLKNRKAINL